MYMCVYKYISEAPTPDAEIPFQSVWVKCLGRRGFYGF